MRKALFLFLALLLLIQPISAQSNFLENTEKSNYREGVGNITYPVEKYVTMENSFGESILTDDINGDGNKEIIGASLLNGTLDVYDSKLNLMWEFKHEMAHEWEPLMYGKITALATGDLDGDGVSDILFSMAPSVCPLETPIYIPEPFSVIYAFKGDGTLLWNTSLKGGITQESLEICDIDGDGRNEILAGGSDLYVLFGSNGTLRYRYNLSNYSFRGIPEIISHENEIVFSFWHYSEARRAYDNMFRVYNSFYNIEKIRLSNNSFQKVWETELENDDSASSPQYQRFFATEDFSMMYISRERISFNSYDSLVCIDLMGGKIKWENDEQTVQQTGIGVAVVKNEVVWNVGNKVVIFDSDGRKIYEHAIFENSSTSDIVRPTLSVFDADGDGRKEIIFTDSNNIYSFDMKEGTEKWKTKLWDGPYVCPIDAPILHSDTDNDGYDEIITTDPEGRIVIIDSGSPPQDTEEPETSANNLMFAGIGAGAIVISVAALWIRRKRRDEK